MTGSAGIGFYCTATSPTHHCTKKMGYSTAIEMFVHFHVWWNALLPQCGMPKHKKILFIQRKWHGQYRLIPNHAQECVTNISKKHWQVNCFHWNKTASTVTPVRRAQYWASFLVSLPIVCWGQVWEKVRCLPTPQRV